MTLVSEDKGLWLTGWGAIARQWGAVDVGRVGGFGGYSDYKAG
jgi:hypothetical protein